MAERTVGQLVNNTTDSLERRHVSAGGSAVSVWYKNAVHDAESKTVKLWQKLKRVAAF
jgi:hypothetical protein